MAVENRRIERRPRDVAREKNERDRRDRRERVRERKKEESKMEADVCRARSRGDCLDVP